MLDTHWLSQKAGSGPSSQDQAGNLCSNNRFCGKASNKGWFGGTTRDLLSACNLLDVKHLLQVQSVHSWGLKLCCWLESSGSLQPNSTVRVRLPSSLDQLGLGIAPPRHEDIPGWRHLHLTHDLKVCAIARRPSFRRFFCSSRLWQWSSL